MKTCTIIISTVLGFVSLFSVSFASACDSYSDSAPFIVKASNLDQLTMKVNQLGNGGQLCLNGGTALNSGATVNIPGNDIGSSANFLNLSLQSNGDHQDPFAVITITDPSQDGESQQFEIYYSGHEPGYQIAEIAHSKAQAQSEKTADIRPEHGQLSCTVSGNTITCS